MTRALPEPSFRRFAAGVGTLSLARSTCPWT
jgi:hypothetical protein